MSMKFTTLVLNWYANPYHAPLFLAKHLNYYKEVDIDLAITQPNDPSDVTKIVGHERVDIGLKAMIHTIAARTRGYNVVSLGTLLDEPITGLIFLKSSGIKTFQDIIGKRIGYIGEFGEKIIDHLAFHAGISKDQYETVRVGMHMVDAIKRGSIDAGIGFSNFHQVELEALCGEAAILRIDEMAGLGCCCFCSIQIITHERFLRQKREVLEAFLSATHKAATYVTQYPEESWEILASCQPQMNTQINKKIFVRTLPIFSRNLLNIDRDWAKVYHYTQSLGLHAGDLSLDHCYTNDLVISQQNSSSCATSIIK